MDSLPVYRVVLEGDSSQDGVTAVSLVTDPAIGFHFLALADEQKEMQFKADKPKYLLTGPALVPNAKIYRADPSGGYFVVFPDVEVEKLAQQFAEKQRTRSLTHQHSESILDQTVVESWIVENPELDKAKALGFSVPKGTWMLSVKVTPEYWAKHIETGKVRGFSVEVTSGLAPMRAELSEQKLLDTIMTYFEKLRAKLEGETPDAPEAKDGSTFSANVDGKPAIVTIDAKGRATYTDGKKTKPLPNGMYTRGDQTYVVVNGKVQDLQQIQFEANPDAKTSAQLDAMTVLTPDGSAIVLPEPGEDGAVKFPVTDASGNVVGEMVFVPAETQPVESSPADSTDPAASPDQVASLKKQLAESLAAQAQTAKQVQAIAAELATIRTAKPAPEARGTLELEADKDQPAKIDMKAFLEKSRRKS